MISAIQSVIPYLVLSSHIALGVLFVALLSHRSFGKDISHWVGKHALTLGFLVSLVAVLGSLFYSNVVGFDPCVLCWWQRIFIYPTLILFITALINKERGVFRYILPLSLIASVIALYHSYVQWGGDPLIPCSATASCSKLYVYAFNYITIPSMSLTIGLALILIYWANRIYENRNS